MKPITYYIFIALYGIAMLAVGQRQPTRKNATGSGAADSTRSSPRIALLARNYGDSVVLRWSPTTAAHWLRGNQLGYVVERIEFERENANSIKTMTSTSSVKPWSLEQFGSRFKPGENYVAVAAQMVHGKGYTQTITPEIAAILKLHQEQTNRHSIALLAADISPKAATALGLRWVDKTPRKKESVYAYRVYMANTSLKANDLRDTASVTILPGDVVQFAAPLVEEAENGDGAITLVWRRRNAEGHFTAFYIERSSDGKQFTRLDKEPYIQSPPDASGPKRDSVRYRTEQDRQEIITYTDSVKVNYKQWFYRIVGVDAFGDLSPASEVLTGMSVDLTPPLPPKGAQAQVIDNKQVKLSWQRNGAEADLQGYVIGRGMSVNGPFEPVRPNVLPANSITFTDDKPLTPANYYVVGSVDTAGNVAYTLPLAAPIVDRAPPKAPTGLTATVDTNGVVRISWPVSADPDVAGYKVYRSYERTNEYYQQLTPSTWPDLGYEDTLPLPILNKVVYYKLVAIDQSNNHSLFSEPLEVKVPDRLPPAPPVIKNLVADAKGVSLNLIASSSTDVTEHRLYRQEGTGDWRLLRRITNKPSPTVPVRDSTVATNRRYTYALTAIDDTGLESKKSFAVPVDYVVTKTPAVRNLQARYDANRRLVNLKWNVPLTKEDHHFIIYRAGNGESLSMYRAVDSNQTEFQDNSLNQAGRYEYAVKVQYHQSGGSALSETVRITQSN